MKRLLTNSVAAITVAATLFSPMLVSAATMDMGAQVGATANGASVGVAADFCTNIGTWSSTVNDRLATFKTNLDAREQASTNDVAKRKDMRGQDLSNLRDQQDADRAAIYAELSAKATTDAQKTALAQFQTTIDAAVQARHASVDAALQTYWQGLDSVMANRQAAVQKAETDFTSAIQVALSTASSDCANGTAALTVRTHFAASVKTAFATFVTDRKAIDKSGPQIKVLVQARNASVKTAIGAFKTVAEKARVQLKASFSATATQ